MFLSNSTNGNQLRRRTRDSSTSIPHITSPKTKALLRERDATIASLQKQVLSLQNQLANLSKEQAIQNYHRKRQHKPRQLTPYGTTVRVSTSKSGGRRRQIVQAERSRMGRNASIATSRVLDALEGQRGNSIGGVGMGNGATTTATTTGHPHANDALLQGNSTRAILRRITEMFSSPADHVPYLKSDQFAKDLHRLNKKVRAVLEDEPRCVFLQSPAYVFGDIHGNLEDLHFFSDNIWNLGMSLTAGNFVFLGDYVDRGMSCLECVAYLFAMKLSLPHKVFLLRGNHETRDVNGWEEHYGARSFIYQCQERFGQTVGFQLWNEINETFDRMPLAAVIDQDIFCVHGGIPRPISDPNADGGRIRDILNVSKVAGINPPYEHEEDEYQQVASDCIWSDPASEEQERTSVDEETGYGDSLRGGGAICFGHKAVSDFLAQQGFSYIMRAHEAHAEGVAVSKGARVFTVFSTSKDHNQGNNAMAGCILIDFEKMQVINRSPAYRNQYIHRRDSVSLAMLSEQEITERVQLGLITMVPSTDEQEEYEDDGHEEVGDDEEYQEEEFQAFDEEGDEDLDELDSLNSIDDDDDDDDSGVGLHEGKAEYTLDTRRKSSVDPCNTTSSPEKSSHDNHDWSVMDNEDDGYGGNGGSVSKRINFSGVDSSSRRRKTKKKSRFSSISEEVEGDEVDDEDSTVNGDDDDDANMEAIDDTHL
mmetsp:Transcript_963/g.2062  ORF Transcript_963/g.2062 Transcript_963/m.2062 type:complete len:706 (-) Transcript_963:212-2329(-)